MKEQIASVNEVEIKIEVRVHSELSNEIRERGNSKRIEGLRSENSLQNCYDL